MRQSKRRKAAVLLALLNKLDFMVIRRLLTSPRLRRSGFYCKSRKHYLSLHLQENGLTARKIVLRVIKWSRCVPPSAAEMW